MTDTVTFKAAMLNTKSTLYKNIGKISRVVKSIPDRQVQWQLLSSLAYAKSSYGYNLLFPINNLAKETIEVQWRKSITTAYNLPQKASKDRLMRATLQATPAMTARKFWIAVNNKAKKKGDFIHGKAR